MARHPSPSLAALSIVHGVLFLTGLVVTTVVAGSHFPSPFGGATTWFALHPNAVLASAFFTFGSAIPLGIYAATASSRLRFLGVEAAGGTIAAFGGFGASFFLALSGCSSGRCRTSLFARFISSRSRRAASEPS